MRQTTAEAALVEEFRPLVRRIAHSIKRRVSRVEIDDLVQAGLEGLIKAAPRFKPEFGASLATFVGHRIRGAMVDSLRETDWAPRSVSRAGRSITKAIRVVEVREQRPARETEIAAEMDLTLEDYRALLYDATCHHVFNLESTPAAYETTALDHHIDDDDVQEKIRAALALIPERERYIIEATYLGDATLLECAGELGITESRVCQLRSQGVARLRALLVEGVE